MKLNISSSVAAVAKDVYYVHFYYGKYLLSRSGGMVVADCCECDIHYGPCLRPNGICLTPETKTGSSVCSPLDQWDTYVGRRLAFTRAIRTYPRPLRKALWDAFNSISPWRPPLRMKRLPRRQNVGNVSGGVAAA